MADSNQAQTSPKLCGRVWVEVNGAQGINEAGADLLEQIDAFGSLSQAARRLGFSYRRAWTLVDTMNRHWPTPLVITTTGGRNGGGAQLTDYGHAVLWAYRDLQFQLSHFLDHATAGFARAVSYRAS